MCNKVDYRIECAECGYPYSEAMYPDDYDAPLGGLPCAATHEQLLAHISEVQRLEQEVHHYYDCKCLLCR